MRAFEFARGVHTNLNTGKKQVVIGRLDSDDCIWADGYFFTVDKNHIDWSTGFEDAYGNPIFTGDYLYEAKRDGDDVGIVTWSSFYGGFFAKGDTDETTVQTPETVIVTRKNVYTRLNRDFTRTCEIFKEEKNNE